MMPTVQSTTRIVGLIGHPIEHTYSPLIHNAAFEKCGLDLIYVPFDIHPSNLKDAIRGMTALNIVGFNVTIPHKQRMLELLDEFSPEAHLIGAVNTVVNDGFKLHGYNTDAHGFLATLRPFSEQIKGEPMAILGAGGAARAVLYGLMTEMRPKQLFLLNRHLERAESLRIYLQRTFSFGAATTHELFETSALDSLVKSRLIVNTTPSGMYPENEESPIVTERILSTGQIIMDLVYNPPETKLMRMAKEKGATVIGGWEMLLQQAAKSFELWTGMQMPIQEVRSVLLHRIQPQ